MVAIKIVDIENILDDMDDVQKEVTLHATFDSPYITKYYSSFIVGTELWISMEFVGGGSCVDLLKIGPLDERYIQV